MLLSNRPHRSSFLALGLIAFGTLLFPILQVLNLTKFLRLSSSIFVPIISSETSGQTVDDFKSWTKVPLRDLQTPHEKDQLEQDETDQKQQNEFPRLDKGEINVSNNVQAIDFNMKIDEKKVLEQNHLDRKIKDPTSSSSNLQPTVKLGRNWGGQMCNRLLTIGAAFEFAKYKNAKLILHGEWLQYLTDFADLERLRERSEVDYVLQEGDPGNTTFTVNVKYALRCGLISSSKWIREALRPNKQHRERGEAVIDQIRKDTEQIVGPSGRSLSLISIHLRRGDFVCRNGTLTRNGLHWFQNWQVCHGDWRHSRIDKDRFCNHSLDDYFYHSIRAEAPHLNLTSYSVFVSTDWQDEFRDSTFFDEDLKRRYGIVSSRKTARGTPMAVDMWASTLSDLHVANGYTSCGPILAMWRAEMATDGRNLVAPQTCYKGFEEPVASPPCFGDRYERRMLAPR